MTDKSPALVSTARRRALRLRLSGIIVLLLGLGGGGTVFLLGARSPDFSDDPAMAGYDRAEDRQMGVLYGKQGELVDMLVNDLRQPDIQAGLIGAVAVIIAAAFFYFARLLDHDAASG